MDLAFKAEDARFREELRAFLAVSLTQDIREETARETGVFSSPTLATRWQRILFERGWGAPSWPREFGGTGWTAIQRLIFDQECALASAPRVPAMGLSLVAPIIIAYGTPAQQQRFLPGILSGTDLWCQGYSEPQAGSDLASLQTSAVRDGDAYVTQGTKIWTTLAHAANWIFLLVRTSKEGRPQDGITFLVTPMDAPGISVRPIRSMSGEHEINQVFLDRVRVPVANRIGDENRGWTVAKRLLEVERGGAAYSPAIRGLFARVYQLLSAQQVHLPDFENHCTALELARCEIDAFALEWTEIRGASGDPDPKLEAIGASLKKIIGSELRQRIEALAVAALGRFALSDHRRELFDGDAPVGPRYTQAPVARFLNGRAATIFGGTNEIQRNLIAKVVLTR